MSRSAGNDASQGDFAEGRLAPPEVREMFGAIAPRYDLLNHVLSLGLDVLWRRRLARLVAAERPQRVVDLCCGTGDVAAAVARRLAGGSEVLGLDFCEPMVRRAREKSAGRFSPDDPHHAALSFAVAEATALPLEADWCDAVTVAFGVRNVPDRAAMLAEMLRIARPGARLFIMDFCRVRSRLWRAIFGFYFRRVVPIVGRLVSDHPGAYTYLPASVARFAEPERLADELRQAGAADVAAERLAGGAVALVIGRKPA